MQGNDKKDSDIDKKSFPKIKSKGIPIFTAVCVTAIITAAAAAFFINNSGGEENEPVQFNYSSQVTVYTTQSLPEETRGSSKTEARSSSSKKTASETASAETSYAAETQTQTETQTEMVYSFPADINLVSAEQLMQIDGIGEVTARKILDYRGAVGVIHDLDMLLEIDGIGEATLEKLKGYLYVADKDYIPATSVTTQAPSTTAETSETVTTAKRSSGAVSVATTVKTTSRTTTTAAPLMKIVNINTASAQELSEGLLIDIELAEDIVELRTNIQYFVNDLELLYVEGFSKEMLVERRPYITL
ncbi:helix-hairpin-helix domain-containing protein [Ruminococcus sp. Marseille-P6503]|uniref:ComEA family DNA-binding protein n=1 Tax=Ruminococcus sp. Marseille-P6503 TaxID=2364796 RepID=UPI000F541692|nr:helix-hairpin-helix domain-containing protein [Ruminococcus sp. Marseille-P6503]